MSYRKPFRATPVRLGPHYREKRRREMRAQRTYAVCIAVLAIFVTAGLSQLVSLHRRVAEAARSLSAPAAAVYYARCSDAWAAGAAPIHRGQPGYRPELDRDGDGVACEPYRGR